MRVFIDADPIVYRAGFAAEDNHYEIIAESEDGELHQSMFTPSPETKDRKRRTAWQNAQEWMKENKLTLVDKIIHVVPQELNYALQIVRTQVLAIIDPIAKKFGLEASELSSRVYLSGPDNFREELATLKPYKGNRDASHKPFHYQAIRDYLTSQWGAQVVHGREADDEVSIRAWEMWNSGERDGYVIATIDKDLDQVPGAHYDYMKHVFTDIDEAEGELFFWQQVISGDDTDHIGGVCGYAADKAKAAVLKWQELAEKERRDWREVVWKNTVELYRIQAGYRKCYYATEKGELTLAEAEKIALENARLVYMQRAPLELWTPPGQPRAYLEGGIDD
jgi:hypothetical protein